mmetsp:Transcript_30483/g.50495  ORF Transcript_30483/g.50495 Transcript_30483/m.50495 type:complete len:429 (-) Transcript_30483:295-1581(-)|eukprot:CAMPEP_0119323436 /NCGR_PEP_ID=MMETSP1333-20130426/60699_1 /TAXON_ID=418940 /ORGANISM="Scyphosphaera apsteinii, Strain RCC1455" /LENGTH=428 /DNA_ID=CAMNT_0007330883 /DNA_START=225 /DNA_END=1511 /DNA_ORIENTATION=-
MWTRLTAVSTFSVLLLICLRRRLAAQMHSVLSQNRSLLELKHMLVLRHVLSSHLGLDIGGTMAKLVIAVNMQGLDSQVLKQGRPFGPNSRLHLDLAFSTRHGGVALSFMSTPTDRLEETARSLRDRLLQNIQGSGLRKVVTAGGGAHKYKEMLKEVLHVKVVPFKELQAVVDGLLFLVESGPPDEFFSVGPDGHHMTAPMRADTIFPFLCVNVGSGVSILRVDGPSSFTRVGGTSCGGATFLGLAQALVGTSDFAELCALASRGDASQVDITVGDIYGSEGCVDLGMPSNMTAANFGKFARSDIWQPSERADAVRALLLMVVQVSVVLSKAFASHAGCMDRIFFVGGFLRNNELARVTIAQQLSSVGGRAIFCVHSEFLGALGSLSVCLSLRKREENARRRWHLVRTSVKSLSPGRHLRRLSEDFSMV